VEVVEPRGADRALTLANAGGTKGMTTANDIAAEVIIWGASITVVCRSVDL
jgi:hypothetical protein